jgi:hypothetical protein
VGKLSLGHLMLLWTGNSDCLRFTLQTTQHSSRGGDQTVTYYAASYERQQYPPIWRIQNGPVLGFTSLL